MITTNHSKDQVKNANSLNWGFFRNDASAAKVQTKLKADRDHVQRLTDIGVDIDVNALPKDQVQQYEDEKIAHRNQMFSAGFMIGVKPPEKLKSLDDRKAEYRDILHAAAPKNPEKPASDSPTTQAAPVISGTMPQNGIRFLHHGKEIPVSEARDLLSPVPEANQDELETKRDKIFALLEKQKELSAKARLGKSLDEQRVISEAGIENQIMATHTRQLYAELTETAVAQKDMTRLLALEEAFNDLYGEFTNGN